MGILRVLIRRLLAAVPTFLLVAIGAFALLEAAPGDAADAYLAQTGGDAGFAAAVRRQLGLDLGLADRLARFFAGLATADLGVSAVFNRPVVSLLVERAPVTLALMAGAVALAALFGSALGLLAGARPGGLADRLSSVLTLGLLSVPSFWLALLLILWFGLRLGWLPIGGLQTLGGPASGSGGALDLLRHLLLPTVALGAGYAALYMRTLRAGMVEAWSADHVRAARARGLKQWAVVWRAVARPAFVPVVVLVGQQAGTLFGGSVVIETVFAIPGMGRLAYEAVAGRDILLLVGIVLAGALVVIVANLLVDLALARLDPRIRLGHG
jgi:peptide/nickel transport system permease protein